MDYGLVFVLMVGGLIAVYALRSLPFAPLAVGIILVAGKSLGLLCLRDGVCGDGMDSSRMRTARSQQNVERATIRARDAE